ncbi:hypothetical protein GCM10022378_11380 [Salinicoccus jeotgali]|uniref:Uncharacterized protein n=1 Tax=Salinicoccus jeotgali TaxID=381634 RepID=A0ABP7ESW4_9STAP
MASGAKRRKKKVYRYLRHGNIMAEGTVETIAKRMGKSEMGIYQIAYRTKKGLIKGAEKVVEYGKYEPVYDLIRDGALESTGTIEELSEALFLSKETIKTYVSKKERHNIEVKYRGTKLVKLEEMSE